jgi:hypothetical protein
MPEALPAAPATAPPPEPLVSVSLEALLDGLAERFAKEQAQTLKDLVIAEETNKALNRQYKDAVEKNAKLVELLRGLQAQVESHGEPDAQVEQAE